MPASHPATALRILFICVLYKMRPEDSPAARGLSDLLPTMPDARVLLWDNTPGQQPSEREWATRVLHKVAGSNVGLASAYNEALRRAAAEEFPLICTLDQDSTVTRDFLTALAGALREDVSSRVSAWVPRVTSHGRLMSPYTLTAYGLPKYGCVDNGCFAINSFSVYRTEQLLRIGGYDEFYWLDGLDSHTFASLRRAGAVVAVLPVDVEHRLSLHEGKIDPVRLNGIARFEAAFISENLTVIQKIGAAWRLLARGLRCLTPPDLMSHLPRYVQSVIRGYAEGARRRKQRGR